MEIYPAIDILGGKAVRLERGDYGAETVYSDSPVQTALDFKQAGANFLHVVDLDGAKAGAPINFGLISEIASAAGLFTQIGGGIRDMASVERYLLQSGLSRVILGTAAVRDAGFLGDAVREFGGRIAVGVDVKDSRAAVSGWLEDTELDGLSFCARLRDIGVKTIIYTDISKDGMLTGPNFDAYVKLSELEGADIIASGGVSGADDLRKLAETGIHGAIIGKAFYAGRLNPAKVLSIKW